MAATTTIRRTGRPLAAAPRGARKGHRPRRIHPYHAAARHAACQDFPQHGGARPHQVDRYRAQRAKCPASIAVYTSDDVRKVIPDPYYGPAFHDQPILAIGKVHYRRRAGRGRAGQRSARRRAGGAADRRRIRGTAGGVRRGRSGREQDAACMTSSSPPAPSPTSSISRAARAPISRSISACGAATSTRPSPRAAHVFEHTFRTQKVLHLALEPYRLDRRLPRRRRHHLFRRRRGRLSCAPRSRACSAGRKTACASRCRISAAATAASSTSRWKRWRSRCRCWRAGR